MKNEKIEDALSAVVIALIFVVIILFVFYCGMQYEKSQRFEQLRTELVGGPL